MLVHRHKPSQAEIENAGLIAKALEPYEDIVGRLPLAVGPSKNVLRFPSNTFADVSPSFSYDPVVPITVPLSCVGVALLVAEFVVALATFVGVESPTALVAATKPSCKPRNEDWSGLTVGKLVEKVRPVT